MPDRILRERILKSKKVNSLTWAEEVFYRRLHSVADDFGCFDASPAVLRTSLYPKQLSKVSEQDVTKWMQQIAKAGLVRLYEHDDDVFLEIIEFNQRLRQKRRKYPAPPICCQSAGELSTSGQPVFESEVVSEDEGEGKSPPPFGGMKDIDLIKESCILDRGYFTDLHCMKYSIDKDALYKWLVNFNQWLRYQATTVKTERDYRTHFGNWFSKQENKKQPELWQIDKASPQETKQDYSIGDHYKQLLDKQKNGSK